MNLSRENLRLNAELNRFVHWKDISFDNNELLMKSVDFLFVVQGREDKNDREINN